MVKQHNLCCFFITSMVVPSGTAAPVLLKWFLSRDVPTGSPSSNGTIIPIPIPSFPLLVYLHSSQFTRKTDGAKTGVAWSDRPIHPDIVLGITRRSDRARNAFPVTSPLKGIRSILSSFMVDRSTRVTRFTLGLLSLVALVSVFTS